MTPTPPVRVNSNDVVVNFPDRGCPACDRRDKHVHTQVEWVARRRVLSRRSPR
jgi:hypothetical protein